jgi:phosphotransferase system  glucose/maltose/N-acetylglucosamine-specific IIC component
MTAEHLREWMRVAKGVRRVGFVSMVTLLLSGVYMMAMVWGGVAWIMVTLETHVLLPEIAMALSRPWMTAIERAMTTETGLVSPTLHS